MTIEERLHCLSKHGYMISIDVDADENRLYFDGSLMRGDSNCPHPGGYNPASGHGMDYFLTDDRYLIGTTYEHKADTKLYEAIGLTRETKIQTLDELLTVFEKAADELEKRPKAK